MPTRGFLFAISQDVRYAHSVSLAAGSIKDFYPEAHITLFCPEWMLPSVDKSNFDIINTDDVPDHIRTKLYALSRTPYTELTVYVDADMECQHEDVRLIWDQIHPHTDILITLIRPYNAKITRWPKGELIHHGGFFLYRSNEQTLNFMSRWWKDYVKLREEWPYDLVEYPIELRKWDQFTFWKLLNEDKLPVRIDVFKDDARWNFVNGYNTHETKSPIIFYHHTVK